MIAGRAPAQATEDSIQGNSKFKIATPIVARTNICRAIINDVGVNINRCTRNHGFDISEVLTSNRYPYLRQGSRYMTNELSPTPSRLLRLVGMGCCAATAVVGISIAGAGVASAKPTAPKKPSPTAATTSVVKPSLAPTPGNFLTNLTQNIGKFGTNLQHNTGVVGTNLSQNLGTVGTNVLINGGTVGSNLQKNLGTVGTNLLKNFPLH